MKKAYNIFHLNLSYSSIDEEDRALVIERCYYPLLNMIETMNIPVGIELSACTLRQIQLLSPQWVEKLQNLVSEKLVEIVGSGYVQIIAPLVPYEVNCWNQEIGRKIYEVILGYSPKTALINEMAFSNGIVELYKSSGYSAIVLDRANIKWADPECNISILPTREGDGSINSMALIWSDTVLFQKFQRYIHGEISLKEYLCYVSKNIRELAIVPVYCNDAEIFDYRPGRYFEESEIHRQGEWRRIMGLYDSLTSRENIQWVLPGVLLEQNQHRKFPLEHIITNARHPITTKKQPKYNICRWAASGRNDIWLNTMCYRIYNKLKHNQLDEYEYKKRLCEFWGSDYRTHITQRRWQTLCERIISFDQNLGTLTHKKQFTRQSGNSKSRLALKYNVSNVEIDNENMYLSVSSDTTKLVLNVRRGLAIEKLRFASQDYIPVIGTIHQGYYNDIELGADWYSGHTVMEYLTRRRRITDLQRVIPNYYEEKSSIIISANIKTEFGSIHKRIRISKVSEEIEVGTFFNGWQRDHNTVRVASITLMPEAFTHPLRVKCKNGGQYEEVFVLDTDCTHASPASNMVSSSAGFGATDGKINIGDNNRSIQIEWDIAETFVFPMLSYQLCGKSFFARLSFSLSEIDDTYVPGGYIQNFCQRIRPQT